MFIGVIYNKIKINKNNSKERKLEQYIITRTMILNGITNKENIYIIYVYIYIYIYIYVYDLYYSLHC